MKKSKDRFSEKFSLFMLEWNLKNYAPVLLEPFRKFLKLYGCQPDLLALLRQGVCAGWTADILQFVLSELGEANGKANNVGRKTSTGSTKKTPGRGKVKA